MKLLCLILGHKYKKRNSWRKGKYVLVVCERCKKRWLMNHEHECLLPWDEDCDVIVKDLERGY
jgi:hypothetical protein